MKIKIILYTLSLSFLIFASVRCSDDDHVVEFNKNIAVDINDIEMDPGKEAIVKITDGNGDYTVKSTDEAIATATIDGTNVKIKGHGSGIASLIVTDGKEVNSVVKVLVYNDLVLENESIEMHTLSSSKVQINSGNGEYWLKSLDESLDVRLETNEKGVSYIVINSGDVELTDATIMVYDRTMRSATVTVKTVDPYIAIKEDAKERIQYRTLRKELGATNVVFYNNTTSYAGFRLFGWIENNSTIRKFEVVIPASQDLKTIGAKGGNTQVKYNLIGYNMGSVSSWTKISTNPPLKVIKYDESTNLVWIVFYYGTYQGIICMKV